MNNTSNWKFDELIKFIESRPGDTVSKQEIRDAVTELHSAFCEKFNAFRSTSECTAWYDVYRGLLETWRNAGNVRAKKIGGLWFWHVGDIEQAISKRKWRC
ncbi:MAG: hypothetical protein WC455_27650 [Dehalococcoidia bacterium]|jgi:hypothetical protein